MKIDAKSDSEDVRVYVNGILHLRFSRDKNIFIHSWIQGHTKTYVIEFISKKIRTKVEYDNKYMWEKVLALLNKNI